MGPIDTTSSSSSSSSSSVELSSLKNIEADSDAFLDSNNKDEELDYGEEIDSTQTPPKVDNKKDVSCGGELPINPEYNKDVSCGVDSPLVNGIDSKDGSDEKMVEEFANDIPNPSSPPAKLKIPQGSKIGCNVCPCGCELKKAIFTNVNLLIELMRSIIFFG
jgi:hypothetical protein